jgi:putative MATE family efflux protein
MKNLTEGSVTRHLIALSGFVAISMVFQTLYFLADLYWVGRLGKESIAAVSLAGNVMFLVLALTQMLGVGATTLVSHAAGAGQKQRAVHVFNQSYVLSLVTGVAFAVAAYALAGLYTSRLAADAETARLGLTYLNWFIPALLLQFLIVAMGSALRGAGVVKPTVAISVLTVILNMVLNPILIFGWGTGHPLGVAGAAIGSVIAIAVGVVMFFGYFLRSTGYLRFDLTDWKPEWKTWWEMMRVGAPAGGEFVLISTYMVVVYWIIRHFGAAAQAGFGIGGRLMQALFLPVVAIAFAAAPLAGQNFGARKGARVRQSFYSASVLATIVMLLCTALCQLFAEQLIRAFSKEPAVIAFGAEYLRIISWNFICAGLSFTTSSIFQGLGHTLPPLASSSLRLVLFALPAYLLSLRPGFEIREIWYLSVASVTIQAVVNIVLLHREFGKKLKFDPVPEEAVAAAAAALE